MAPYVHMGAIFKAQPFCDYKSGAQHFCDYKRRLTVYGSQCVCVCLNEYSILSVKTVSCMDGS